MQGLGGAVVSAVALSLMMPHDRRAKAMGVFGFVAAGGGSIGVLLGGILTDVLDWHWIFLVNVPIGVAVYVVSLRLLPSARGPATTTRDGMTTPDAPRSNHREAGSSRERRP